MPKGPDRLIPLVAYFSEVENPTLYGSPLPDRYQPVDHILQSGVVSGTLGLRFFARRIDLEDPPRVKYNILPENSSRKVKLLLTSRVSSNGFSGVLDPDIEEVQDGRIFGSVSGTENAIVSALNVACREDRPNHVRPSTRAKTTKKQVDWELIHSVPKDFYYLAIDDDGRAVPICDIEPVETDGLTVVGSLRIQHDNSAKIFPLDPPIDLNAERTRLRDIFDKDNAVRAERVARNYVQNFTNYPLLLENE